MTGQTQDNPLDQKPSEAKGTADENGTLNIEDDENELLAIEEEPTGSSIRPQAKRTFGSTAAAAQSVRKTEFNRPLNLTGTGATRCRIFHSKISAASLDSMETQINEWIDGDQIEVKHVGHLMGVMEGKRDEPNVLVMVWY